MPRSTKIALAAAYSAAVERGRERAAALRAAEDAAGRGDMAAMAELLARADALACAGAAA